MVDHQNNSNPAQDLIDHLQSEVNKPIVIDRVDYDKINKTLTYHANIKPTPTLTKEKDIIHLFDIMNKPSNIRERIKREKKKDNKLFKKIINS